MEKTLITMIENLHKNTGRTLEQWIDILKSQNFEKHGEIIKFLKTNHDLTHGFANLIAHQSKDSNENSEDLITKQYQGKEHLKSIYEKLINEVNSFGKDIEIAPKKAYVSLRRSKQFATLKPATKTRFEIGINLKGQEAQGKLEAEKPNSMCSHKIKLTDVGEIDKEIITWLEHAYENA